MLKLGKSNIKYLASGKQLQAAGGQGYPQARQEEHNRQLFSRPDVLGNLQAGQSHLKGNVPTETHE